ncbi:SDR family oxidoreductase [Granulicella cerasi]|uniref:SDR family oxidoreductase n=1 Tax=Granulicella cerasi TaxID=741063 RepID=A0ABW1Z725_9BACT|nr:SDR family oxidoreductase [Granulicella cerasi]
MIAVTGATGHLGHLVVDSLLSKLPADQIVAVVRTPAKAAALAAKGVAVREGDFSKPETLSAAFVGVEKLLLVSSSEVGQRIAQHQAVIDAAKAAGVKFIAYTSLLKADTATMQLATEHVATEKYLQASGVAFALLRNGWYTENHMAALAPSVAHGAIIGAAGEGRFATAPRADYAEAAAVVLATAGHENKIYELAGDTSYNYAELAHEAAEVSGKPVAYARLSEAEYAKALEGFGLPPAAAAVVANADASAAKGELDSTSGDLARLIGRATVPWQNTVAETLKQA